MEFIDEKLVFGYFFEGEEYFFETKKETLDYWERHAKSLQEYDITREEFMDMTQFAILFNTKEGFENA